MHFLPQQACGGGVGDAVCWGMQVKPIYLGGVLKELAPFLEDRHLVVSIAAGVKVLPTTLLH